MPVQPTVHAYVASEEFYPNDSVIIEEGTVGDWVYVILEGSAKVRKKTPKGLVTVDTLKEGDVFGEMGFLEGGKRLRSASVVASGDVWVGVLDGEKLTRDFEMIPSNKVRKKTPKGLITVDTLKEGDVFGEMGFLEGGKRLRSASVVASGDVWVGILDGEKLTQDFEMIPSNLRALIRSLVLKLREITTNVCSLASVQDEK